MPSTSVLSSRNSRRRIHRVGKETTTSNLDDADNKENFGCSLNVSAHQKSKSRSSDFCAVDDHDSVFGSSSPLTHDSNENETIVSLALEQFRKAVSRISTATLFVEIPHLDESVVRASLFPRSNIGLWHIQEHTPSLLTCARRCIKQATSTNGSQSSTSHLDYLLVSLHILRTISSLLEISSGQVETCIRLLYHLITAANDFCTANTVPLTCKKSLACLIISGYQALQGIFPLCPCTATSGQTIWYRMGGSSNENDWKNCALPQWHSSTRERKGTVNLSFRQVASIALKATHAVASILLQSLGWNTLELKHKTAEQRLEVVLFGSLTCSMARASQQLKPVELTSEILKECYAPWLSFISDSGDDDCIKDLSAHCKIAHRLLWEAASNLDADNSHQNPNLEADRLLLRCNAIKMLLPKTNTAEGKNLIAQLHWESACAYAWKASTVYWQQVGMTLLSPRDDHLSKFHVCLGARLDELCPYLDATIHPTWIEYCVYRALHSGIEPNSSYKSDQIWWHIDSDQWKDGQVVTAVVLVSLKLIRQLSLKEKVLNSVVKESQAAGSSCLSQLTETMQSFISSTWETLSVDTQNRIFKMLLIPSLHTTIFQVTKSVDFRGNEFTLEFASLLLTHCVGPLTFAMIQSCVDKSRMKSLHDVLAECYVRPLMALERLAHDCKDTLEIERLQGLADNIMHEMYQKVFETADVDSVPLPFLEKCAKSMGIVAKQRTDRSQRASMVPAMYALKLFWHLANKTNMDYYLPTRLTHLANTLHTYQLHYEEAIVLVLVITRELPQCYENMTDGGAEGAEDQLLQFLAARCKGVFSPLHIESKLTPLAKSSIRRLVELVLVETASSDAMVLDGTLLRAWRAFCAQDMDQDQHPISFLLSNVMEDGQHDDMLLHQRAMTQTLLLSEIAVQMGDTLQRLQGDSSGYLDEFCRVVDLLQNSIREISFDAPSISATINILASTSLIPQRQIDYFETHAADRYHPDNLKLAIEYANAAYSSLESHDDLLLSTAMQHYSCYLEACTGQEFYIDLFNTVRSTMKNIRNARDIGGLSDLTRRSLLWSLSHLQGRLEMGRDGIRAAIVMGWILECADGGNIDESMWFRASANTVFLSKRLLGGEKLLSDLPDLSAPEVDDIMTMHGFPGAELLLTYVRIENHYNLTENKRQTQNRVESLKTEIESVENSSVLKHWLLSSADLTLAELTASAGQYTESLHHLRESCRHCTILLSETKRSVCSGASAPVWECVAYSTLHVRAQQRYTEILAQRAQLHACLGDHRKATAYLDSIAHFLGIHFDHDRKAGPNLSIMCTGNPSTLDKLPYRINAEIRSKISALDQIAQNLPEVDSNWMVDTDFVSSDISGHFEAILNIFSVGDIVYGDAVHSAVGAKSDNYYNVGGNWYKSLICTHDLMNELAELRGFGGTPPLETAMRLRSLRSLMHMKTDQISLSTEVQSLCDKVLRSPVAEPLDKAWSHYYAAMIVIERLQYAGTLTRLWNDEDILHDDFNSLRSAKEHLSIALSVSRLGSGILRRNILRCLALVTGPEEGGLSTTTTGVLVLESIGEGYRQLLSRSIAEAQSQERNIPVDVNAFHAFEAAFAKPSSKEGALQAFFSKMAKVVPQSWKFVAAAICPLGNLLLTSVEKDECSGEFAVSTTYVASPSGARAYDEIMVPLDEIIQSSQSQLSGMNESAVSEHYGKESAKRQWWDNRHNLDEDLQGLLEFVDNAYFHSLHVGAGLEKNSCHELLSEPVGNLAAKFDRALEEPNEPEIPESEETLNKLTVPMLKERLLDDFHMAKSKLSKVKKRDLIAMILDEIAKKEHAVKPTVSDEECIFLILDENLHRFPFEGMPSLTNKTVCRVPSLPFVLATLLENSIVSDDSVPCIDPTKATVILDPESNLHATRSRLSPLLDRIASDQDWEWNSVVGGMPSSSFCEEGLRRENGLFLYFGHGGAQSCFSRKQVEALISGHGDSESVRGCKAALILMGCSSGRLISVNRKHSQTLDEIPLYYEPEGIALSYLCAGAPCVVGNLWDVTDHDIDRYSSKLLEEFLTQDIAAQGGKGKSLAKCVAEARSACKLRYIVGSAPVCYGVPVHLMNKG